MNASRIIFPAVLTVLSALIILFWSASTGRAAPTIPLALEIESPVVQVESLFEFLFAPRRQPRQRERRNRQRRRERAAPNTASAPPPPQSAKNPDAKQVMVIGDGFASGLARALTRRFANTPSITILNRAKSGSGIVRDDYYDWNAEFANFLQTDNAAAIVVMIGSNDRQRIKDAEGNSIPFRTEPWLNIYERRVQKMLDLAYARNIPLFWVGLPIMRSSEYGLEIAFLNELFAQQGNRINAVFVDTWERFGDEDGKYNASGPDENGRIRRLRLDNGIHMSKEGNKKLAYFVDLELRPRLTGLVTSYPLSSSNSFSARDPRTRSLGVEISLTNPPINPRDLTLAGARNEVVSGQTSVTAEEAQLTPQRGRADDFSWPRQQEIGGDAITPPL